MERKRTLTKRRRVHESHIEAEKYNWKTKGWNLVKEEIDERGYTILHFERKQILTPKGWIDLEEKGEEK